MSRILLIVQDLPAGDHEPIVSGAVKNPHHLLNELLRRGHQVQVVSFDRLRQGVPASVDRAIVRYSCRWLRLFPRTVWFNVISLWRIWRLSRHVDVVQSHHPHVTLHLSLLRVLRICRAPLIIKAHGTAFHELHANRYRGLRGFILRVNARLHLWADRFAFAFADAVISSSEYQVREMKELYGIPSERLRVIRNGTSPRPVNCPIKPMENPPRLLFIGRVVPKKGIDRFIAICRAIAAKRTVRARLVLGQRRYIEDRRYFEEVIAPILNDPLFEVLFDIPEQNLSQVIDGCAALLVPSRGYESIPTVIYEAHAAGLVTFATAEWGVPEIIRPEFALSGDNAADAERISIYLDTQTEPAATRAACYLPGEYDWPRLAAKYEALYVQLTQDSAQCA